MAFRDDDRGVSAVVGFILVFGILVLLLTINQSQLVPAQNEETEFQHSQTVQRDMVELRNAILTAKTSGETSFAAVQLGTQYEPRILAINPPPPSGTLRTGDPQPIVIEDGGGTQLSNVCPGGDPIETRTLSYTPSYSVYDEAPTIVYENTVLYLEFDERTVVLTGQQLVQNEGESVTLAPLNTTFSRSSSGTVTVEPVPGQIRNREVEDGSFTVPTGLSEPTWEDLLAGQVDPADVSVSNGNLTISTTGSLDVACAPVGLNQAPAGGQRAGPTDLNPLDVAITGYNSDDQQTVEVTFNNSVDRTANVTRARLTFYQNTQDTGGDIGPIDVIDEDGNTVASLEPVGETQTLDPTLSFEESPPETTITFRNQGGEQLDQRDFFVVDFIFEDGSTRRYFIDVPA
jgi:hypothetical protein